MATGNNTVTTAKRPVPPQLTPWKPGQSGNPNGRPKGISAALKELLREVAKTRDPVTGKMVPTTKQRRMLDVLYAEATTGDNPVRAFEAIRDTVQGKPVSSDEHQRADREQQPQVTVNIMAVLGELPVDALRKLREAAVTAEAQAVRALPAGEDDATG